MPIQMIPSTILTRLQQWKQTLQSWENLIRCSEKHQGNAGLGRTLNRALPDLANTLRNSVNALSESIREQTGVLVEASNIIDGLDKDARFEAMEKEVADLKRQLAEQAGNNNYRDRSDSNNNRNHQTKRRRPSRDEACVACHGPNKDGRDRADDLCARCRMKEEARKNERKRRKNRQRFFDDINRREESSSSSDSVRSIKMRDPSPHPAPGEYM